MKFLGPIFLFLLGCQNIVAQNLDSLNALSKSLSCVNVVKSDSIANVVIKLGMDKKDLNAVGVASTNLGRNRFCESQFKDATKQFRRAVELFEETDNLGEKAKALNNLGTIYRRLSQLDSAELYAKEFLKVSIALNDTALNIMALRLIASLYSDRGMNDSSLYYTQYLLKVATPRNDQNTMNWCFLMIGGVYYDNENFTEALDYYRRAEKGYLSVNDTVNVSFVYFNLANTYSRIDSADLSLIYFQKTLSNPEWSKNKYYSAYCFHGLAHAYEILGDMDKAIDYNLKAIALSEEIDEKRSRTGSFANLSGCYFKVRDYKKAIEYAKRAIKLGEEIGYDEKVADGYWFLALANNALGNYKEAYEAYRKFDKLDSMVINAERNKLIVNLEKKYESEKKDNEISSLSQQAQIQALQLSQRNTQLIGAGVLLLLLVFGVVIVNQQRSLKHRQAVADMEQRVLRLQMNPHFIFNALASIQTYILQSNTKESVSYLSKFAKLMRQILEHSREEFITVKQETEMLKNYIEIQQLRFKDKFEFVIEVDAGIDQEMVRIPPLFAQPFVENAIEHGFKEKDSGGKLTVRFERIGSKISLMVNDNGSGIKMTDIEEKEHRSLATQITRERLNLLGRKFKEVFSLDVDSSLDTGTTARLVLPTLTS